MSPKDGKWQALDNDGSRHTCQKKRKKKRSNTCRLCGEKIVFKKVRGKWLPHDTDNTRHRCKVGHDQKMNMQHMKDI